VTTGAQTYNDAVVLKAKTILDSTSSNITFNQNVDGAFALEMNAQGNEIFSSATQVGATTALASLTTDASGSGVTSGGQTQFNYAAVTGATSTASVVTTGAQTYNDALLLKANTILDAKSGGVIAFNSNVNANASGSQFLELNTAGNEIFSSATQVGATTALASLTTDNPNVGFSGGQTQFNFTATSGDITKAS